MKRDGANKSLWQENDTYVPSVTAVTQEHYDVIIVGGGITGMITALTLQESGKKCLVAEARSLGFGTTSGTTAHLNTFMDSTYPEIEKNFSKKDAAIICSESKEAISLIANNVSRFNLDCGFSSKDGFLFSKNEDETKVLDEIYEASIRAGCEVDYTGELPITAKYEKVIVFRHQAQFEPIAYLYGITRAFEACGGKIIEDCRVTGCKGSEDLEIETSQGVLIGKNLVYATHVPPGVNLLHFRCAPYRSYVLAVELANNAYPDALIYDMENPYHYYRTQDVNGKRYLIAGGEDHKTAHEENTHACFIQLEAHLRQLFEVSKVAYKWSSQFYQPVDGLPYIGHLPGNPSNVFTATGYNGDGMVYSHIVAKVLKDCINGISNELTELLDPNRIKPVAGFSDFVKEAADVVGNFTAGIFDKNKITTLAELAPGEASMIRYDGESMAIYKDEGGVLHAVNPACTHINCKVSFNNTEQSWDCPCHGARYDINGQMLNGPARKDLKRFDLSASD